MSARSGSFLTLPVAELSSRAGEHSFSWPGRRALERLRESVGRFGLLRPLLGVEDDGGGLKLVAGLRRLAALATNGAETAAVRVLGSPDPVELWDLLLEDQLLGGPLNAVELGTYARKRAAATGETWEALAARVLPRLGLAPRAGALEDALWASGLAAEHKDVLAEGGFPAQGLRVLARAPRDDSAALLDLFREGVPGVNKFLEVVRHALECAWAEGLTVREWVVREGLRPPASPAELESLRSELRRRRLPTVCRWEESFDADVRALGLPERVRITHPPGFEGRLTCAISFADLEELRRGAQALLEAADEGKLLPLASYLE